MTTGCWIRLLTSSLLGLTVMVAASGGDDFQSQLELAAELNLTAPWQESQAILDQIEPALDQATPDQFATFHLLKTRNLALAGHYVEGLELTRQLLEHPIPSEHRLSALIRGANLGLELRRFEDAFDYLYQSLVLEPEVDHPEQTTYVYSLAAEIFRTVGKVDRSRDYAHRSVEVAREHDHVRAECVARMHLAAAYQAADHLTAAREHFRSALERCRQANDPVFVAIAEFGLGDTLRRKGRLDEAEAHLNRAQAQHRGSGYRSGEAETLVSLAKLYRATDRSRRAEEILADLIDQFADAERWDFLETTHHLLGRIASEHGDYVQALEHTLKQIDAREHFLDVQRAHQLAYLEIEFETRFQDQELVLLREQHRLSQLQEQTRTQQRRLHTLAYASGGLLTVCLILLLVHTHRDRRHYQRLSGLDSLTGLNNHTRFFDTAHRMVQEAERNNTPLVLVMGDIDHFKQVNDAHGHLVGDEALRQVARILREVFGGRGDIGRIGGEEFAVCLPGETINETRQLLEELRRKIRQVDCGVDCQPLTMSFGLTPHQPGESLKRLRQRADEALYRAKNAGRDAVIIAPTGQSADTARTQ